MHVYSLMKCSPKNENNCLVIWYIASRLFTNRCMPIGGAIYVKVWPPHSNIVGIATGYGLDDRGVGVRIQVGSRIFTSAYCSDRQDRKKYKE
jgi:hypothetical protein